MFSLKTSISLAVIGGILVPVLETIRRCEQILDPRYFINWFDDYVMGAFLLFAALKTKKSPGDGRPYLCAAWGFATGMMFLSFFGQLQRLHEDDPAPISSEMVAIIKGLLFVGCLLGLFTALRKPAHD